VKEAVVIDRSEVFTGLGDLSQTVGGLIAGKSAVRAGHCFGVPVSFSPFADEANRDLVAATTALWSRVKAQQPSDLTAILIYCAAKGDLRAIERYDTGADVSTVPSPLLGGQADAVQRALGTATAGPVVVSNACASGIVGLELAHETLSLGEYGSAIVFGYDSLSRFVATGFNALGALSPTGARPFDANRDGLTLGEGAAIAVLSWRQPRVGDLVVAGCGSSNDANHRTGPSRTGEGLYLAARAALANAGVEPEMVGAVKCHGTATPYNDAMEAKAIRSLFGDAAPPCFSTKGALGHMSGGGSLVETLVAAELLKLRVAPPTFGYQTHGVEESIPITRSSQQIAKPWILCLSAGFGGVNAAAVVGVHA
jgi:3-oxoacyl-(acyl-carrier-protein) synthase